MKKSTKVSILSGLFHTGLAWLCIFLCNQLELIADEALLSIHCFGLLSASFLGWFCGDLYLPMNNGRHIATPFGITYGITIVSTLVTMVGTNLLLDSSQGGILATLFSSILLACGVILWLTPVTMPTSIIFGKLLKRYVIYGY